MRATTSGCEIVWPQPIGSGMLSHASETSSGGTNASRGTLRTALSTRSSVTPARSSATRRSADIGLRDRRASGPHLLQRPLGVTGMHLDAAHRVAVDRDGEALLQRLQRGLL